MTLTDWLYLMFPILWLAIFIMNLKVSSQNKKVIEHIRGVSFEANNSQMDILLAVENLKRRIEEDDRVLNHQTEVFKEELEAITDTLTELRMEIAVLRGMNGAAIPLPYKGAKRGPKPKQVIEQEN